MSSPLIGHSRQMQHFENALATGKTHHGWILSGPRGVGKARFAQAAAALLVDPDNNNARMIDQNAHPDIIKIERLPKDAPKEGEGVDPDAERKRSISIEQIRDVQRKLTTRPTLGPKRALIIDAADDLERSGANALLKSLEEPPEGSFFFLVSHSSERLLPTIRSRCQVLRFDPMNDSDVGAVLEQKYPDMPTQDITALVALSDGSPGRAMQFSGLDIAALDKKIDAIIAGGDPENAIRHQLLEELSLKAAQQRYEIFLQRVPPRISAFARLAELPRVQPVIDAFHAAEALAIRAQALSLDKQAVVFEMGSLLASLQTHKHGAH